MSHDQTVTIHPHITSDHIGAGVMQDATSCPIALAIQEVSPEFSDIRVEPQTIYFEFEGLIYEAATPNDAQLFMERFDACWPVEPFKFDLELSAVNYV